MIILTFALLLSVSVEPLVANALESPRLAGLARGVGVAELDPVDGALQADVDRKAAQSAVSRGLGAKSGRTFALD